ncbi:amyloid fiber anchoring/assembly protein TapA [Sutcliffiella halmapala]
MTTKYSNFVLKNIQKFKSSFKRTNEGGILIRYKRVRKFNHLKKEFSLGIKVIAVWYLMIFSLVQFSETNAGYNDVELLSFPIAAGEWGESPPDNEEWDNSSFEMDGSTVGVEGCTIHTTIYNSGDEANSLSTWRYFVHKLDSSGNVIEEPVNTGVVPLIENKKTGKIESEVSENGEYKIKVRRPLGHPAGNNPDEEGYTYLGWSKKIKVEACSEQSEEEEDAPEETEPVSMEVEGLEGVSSETSITLIWTNPNATTFSYVNVYRNNENTPVAANITNGEFVDTELDADTDYTYRITTVDTNGEESNGATYSIKTAQIVNDEESEEQTIEVLDVKWVQFRQSANVDITWSNPLGDNFSHIILYKDGTRLIETSDKSYRDNGLVKKQDYIYKIVTVTKNGKESEGIEITVNLK